MKLKKYQRMNRPKRYRGKANEKKKKTEDFLKKKKSFGIILSVVGIEPVTSTWFHWEAFFNQKPISVS